MFLENRVFIEDTRSVETGCLQERVTINFWWTHRVNLKGVTERWHVHPTGLKVLAVRLKIIEVETDEGRVQWV